MNVTAQTRDWFPRRKLGDLPAEAAVAWPSSVALNFYSHTWTYPELAAEVERVARALVAAGVQPGDNVGLWVTNRPEFLFAFFAIIRIGAVAIPFNTRWRTRDLKFALDYADITLMISETRSGPVDYEAMLREVTAGEIGSDFPHLRRVIYLPGADTGEGGDWEEFLAAGELVSESDVATRAAQVDPDGVALIIFTSGSTGVPKGVMLSHIGIRLCVERAASFGMTRNDVQINYLPLFHAYSIVYVVLHCILTGARHVLLGRFDAGEALTTIERERVTILHGFDTHYKDLLQEYRRRETVDLSSLRFGTFAAGNESARKTVLEVQDIFCRTVSTYGQSETWAGITGGPIGCTPDQSSAGSGYPHPGVELRITDLETGAILPDGEVGEVWVKTYTHMVGYYKLPEETRKVLDESGWLRTGDLGCIRPDGHFRITGRCKEMLKIGGENVAPGEIENLLVELPAIRQAVVIGCADERLTEVAAAFILCEPGADQEEIRRQVQDHCAGRIASFKIPRRLEFLSEIPVNAAGKIDKLLLRARLETTAPAQ